METIDWDIDGRWAPCLYCGYWVKDPFKKTVPGFYPHAVLCGWCKESCVCGTVWPMSAEHWWCSKANSIAVAAFKLAKMELPSGLRGCGRVVHLVALYLSCPRRLVLRSNCPCPSYYSPPLPASVCRDSNVCSSDHDMLLRTDMLLSSTSWYPLCNLQLRFSASSLLRVGA